MELRDGSGGGGGAYNRSQRGSLYPGDYNLIYVFVYTQKGL